MALSKIYTYKLLPEIDLTVFGITHDISVLSEWGLISFVYFEGENKIHPISVPSAYPGSINLCPQDPYEFVQKWLPTCTIHITSTHEIDVKGLELLGIRQYHNYPKMIDDLEISGKIKTKLSNNYMATDPRKFWFLEDILEYEVDCLGTSMCQSITEKVKNEWYSSR